MTRFHMYAQASKHPHEADEIFVEKPNSGEQVIRAASIEGFSKIFFFLYFIFFFFFFFFCKVSAKLFFNDFTEFLVAVKGSSPNFSSNIERI